MKTPNYHDFYQKALIPIGKEDLKALKEADYKLVDSSSTHWLIAVEGEQLHGPRIYYHWKVSIYQSNSSGDFNWKRPFYRSPLMDSIDSAHILACSLVKTSKLDELSSIKLQEKIS